MADPIPAQKEPYKVSVEAGKKYFWCACGRSKKQPFCDGSHGGTGFESAPGDDGFGGVDGNRNRDAGGQFFDYRQNPGAFLIGR